MGAYFICDNCYNESELTSYEMPSERIVASCEDCGVDLCAECVHYDANSNAYCEDCYDKCAVEDAKEEKEEKTV